MKESASRLNHCIAERVRDLRARQGLSLDALARKSGVSRSMLSVIERGESSATAVMLERLACGLGVTLAALFGAPTVEAERAVGPVSRRQEQTQWKDPGSGYVRRNVSPPDERQPMQITEVHFPAGESVAFETGARNTRVFQQIWILKGTMEITLGTERHRLHVGDCLAMQLDQPILFHNPTRRAARYAVVVAAEIRSRR